MRFKRYGRTRQLRIENAEDLKSVLFLDESLWAATSAPVSVFNCDRTFLDLVDTDGNGRIYTLEVKEAIRWLLDRMEDPSEVNREKETVSLASVRADTPEGEALISSAGYVLVKKGTPDGDEISLSDVRSFVAGIRDRPLNGDGVIVPQAASDPEVKQLIEDVISCGFAVEDVSGRKGVDRNGIEAFSKAVTEYISWLESGYIPEGRTESEVMPFGPETEEMYKVASEHGDKIDTFFAICRLMRFDGERAKAFAASPEGTPGPEGSTADSVESYLEAAYIALPSDDCVLDLSWDAVNPHYRGWLESLTSTVLKPVLGRKPTVLAEGDWREVKSRLEPYAAYLRSVSGKQVEILSEDRLRSYVNSPLHAKVIALIHDDREVAGVLQGLKDLERLILYNRYLMPFVNNFVSFPHLYAIRRRAMFEMGSAVIDERWFDFAVRVDDINSHSAIAKQGGIFILYLEVGKKDGEKKFIVAVPATSGSKGNLDVGKRGVFFDRNGEEYDARIVQAVENPISLREAVVAPFTKLIRLAEGKIEKWSTSSEKELEEKFSKLTSAPAHGMTGGPAGLLLGGGVALAAVGSAFAFITKTLAEVSPLKIALGFLTAIIVVLFPLSLMAVRKLSRQDLSSVLEGCGWAINVRMGLDSTQRRHFTRRVTYPRDASGTPGNTWLIWILLGLLAVLVALGAHYFSQKL